MIKSCVKTDLHDIIVSYHKSARDSSKHLQRLGPKLWNQ